MEKIISVLQLFIYIPVNMLILCGGIHGNLTVKNKSRHMIYIFLPAYIMLSLCLYFSPLSIYSVISRLFANAVLILYFIIFYSEKLSKKIFIISVMYVLNMLSDMITVIITRLPGMNKWNINVMETGIEQLILLTFYNTCFFILTLIFTKIYRKKTVGKVNNGFGDFALVPFSQIFLQESLFLNYTDKSFNYSALIPAIIGLVLSLVADLFLFRGIKSIQEANMNKIKIAELEYRQKLAYSYYSNIQQNIEQTMKYKHDFNNMISTVYTLISSDNIDESIRFLDEMKEKNSNASIPIFCKNPVINSIIYDKKILSENMNIDFNINLDIPKELNIELTDICSIFTNLIDNAFNSACASKNKTVELKVWCELGYLFVRTTNYPDMPSEILISKKHSPEDTHGYGLHILNDISEKYDGCFNITYSKNKIMAICSVRC